MPLPSIGPAFDGACGHEDDHDEEGGDDGATGVLAEALELHAADGQLVDTSVARVHHIHNAPPLRCQTSSAAPSPPRHICAATSPTFVALLGRTMPATEKGSDNTRYLALTALATNMR